jgi:hypothetical protein
LHYDHGQRKRFFIDYSAINSGFVDGETASSGWLRQACRSG